MTPQHKFHTMCHSLTDLFDNVQTLSKFMRNLETQSTIDPIRYDSDKYKGDGFYFLSKYFKL